MGDPADIRDHETQGISEEDQKDILREIERVAGENRIHVADDIFDFQPARNGAIFPLLVNIVGLAILVGGIYLLAQVFASSDAELRSTGRAVVTAESRLIEEIRRETATQIAAKEQEISTIENQLAAIMEERSTLAADVESRIAQREAQLREEFEAELAAERQRLLDLNLSDEEIEIRMAEFTREREQEFRAQLSAFRETALAEQAQLESELDSLESQFNQTLAAANRERDSLQAESEARLQALQSQFEEELNARDSQLSAAEAELAQLSRAQERTELVRGQIRGLYAAVDEALGAGDLTAARAVLQDLRALLNEDTVVRNAALQEQRPVELFIVGALEQLISFEQRLGNPETLQLLNDAAELQQVVDLVAQAELAVANGESESAQNFYRQALDVIPAVRQSVSYLGVTGADSVDDLATIDAAAESIVVEARSAVDAQQWLMAIDQFSTVLQTYPRSRYRQEAVDGIRSAAQNLAVTTESQAVDLNAQIAALEETLANAQSDLASLEAERAEQTQEQRNQISALETALAQQRSALETTEATLADTRSQLNETEEQLSIAQAALEQVDTATNAGTSSPPPEDLVALREAQVAFEGYQSSAPTGNSTVEILNARVSLERFLGMAVMDRLFPGLAQEVGRFDQAYLSSGRENALIDAADLLSDLSAARSTEERERILSSAAGRMAADDSQVIGAADEFAFQLSDLLESVR